MVKKQELSKHSGKSRKIHELSRYKIFKQPSDLKTATQQLAGVDSKGIVVLTVIQFFIERAFSEGFVPLAAAQHFIISVQILKSR
jgi:hypothetical protein